MAVARRLSRSFLAVPLLLATAGWLAPRAGAQFDLFDWTYVPGASGTVGSLTSDTMFVGSFVGDPPGFFGFVTQVPIAGTINVVLEDYWPYDGVCNGTLPVFVVNDHPKLMATCTAHDLSFSFAVPAGSEIGLGLMPLQSGWGGVVSFIEFSFTPAEPYEAWTTLGGSLPGSAGLPALSGQGLLQPNLPVKLTLEQALGDAPTTLVIGLGQLNTPFKGGVLVPSADVLIPGLVTSAQGGWELAGPWPSGIPAGTTLVFQTWIVDGAGVQGLAASNAVQATAP